MRLLELSIRNFLSFGDTPQTLVLAGRGLVLVEGENLDDVTVQSNGCLTGDTLVDCPRDLTKHPKGVPIKDLVGKRPWVYAWDGDKIVVRQADRVWLTKKNAPVVRVRLSKYATKAGAGQGGRYLPPQELVGTADHPVLLADGKTWKALGTLASGDRLCSLYRRESGGWRTLLYWTGSGTMPMGRYTGPRTVSEQQFVCSECVGPKPSGLFEAHHLNDNGFDHTPSNLEWKLRGKHQSEHTSRRNHLGLAGWKASGVHPRGMLGKKHSSETRAKITAGLLRRYAKNDVNHTVLSVEDAGFADVYDMRVPSVGSFVANGVVVHNSGKSALLEALIWALFGKTLRGLSADKVVNNTTGKNCIVSLWLESGGTKYCIERYRKHARHNNKLRLFSGEEELTKSDSVNTQEDICSILGLTYDTFINSVVFGQGAVRHFAMMTDKEQKAVMDKLIGLERIASAHKAAKERLDLTNKAIDVLNIDELVRKLEHEHSILLDSKQSRDLWVVGREPRLLSLTNEIKKLEAASLDSDLGPEIAKAKAEDEEAKSYLSARTGKLGAAGEALRKAREAVKRALTGDIGECDSCGSPVKASELARHKAHLEEAAQVAEKSYKSALRAVDEANVMAETCASEVESLVERRKDAQHAQQMLEKCKKDLELLKEEKNPYESLVDETEGLVRRLTMELAGHQKSDADLKHEQAHLEFVLAMLSDRGDKELPPLKGCLLDNVAPFLNEAANRFSSFITGGNIDISFETQRELQNGELREEFSVAATNLYGADAYDGSSGGEKRKIDLCVALALQSLGASRHGNAINVAFYDEVFESLDDAAVDKVMDLLKEEAKIKDSLFVVTHMASLKSEFESRITVVKQNGFSTLK